MNRISFLHSCISLNNAFGMIRSAKQYMLNVHITEISLTLRAGHAYNSIAQEGWAEHISHTEGHGIAKQGRIRQEEGLVGYK